MKKLLSSKYFILCWAIVVLAVNAILFIVKRNNLNTMFFLTWGFLMFAFVMVLVGYLTGGASKKVPGAIDAVNAPVSVALYFAIVMIFISLVCFVFITKMVAFVPLLAFMIFISAIFLVFYVLSYRQKELIEANPNKIPDLVKMENVPSYLRELFDIATEPTTKGSIGDLIDLASNQPVSETETDELKACEKSIYEYAGYLKKNITKGEYANAYHNIDKLKSLLEKRIDLVK